MQLVAEKVVLLAAMAGDYPMSGGISPHGGWPWAAQRSALGGALGRAFLKRKNGGWPPMRMAAEHVAQRKDKGDGEWLRAPGCYDGARTAAQDSGTSGEGDAGDEEH